MKYTVKSYNVCRVPLSERKLEFEGTYDVQSPLEAVSRAARASPDSLLAFATNNGDSEAIRGLNTIHEGPEGVAVEFNSDVIILVFPTIQGERALFKEVALWEAQFD